MKIKRMLVFLLIITLLGILSIYWPRLTGKSIADSPVEYQREQAFVTRVIDGDTLDVEIGEAIQRVRLLGVNTPEKGQYYYQEAKDFLKEMENKTSYFLRDDEYADRYERRLGYIIYGERIINVEILQRGLGIFYMGEGLKYEEKLKKAEEFALKNELGLWKKSSSACSSCLQLVELNPSDEYFILKNNCNINCNAVVSDEGNHLFKIELGANEEKKFESKGKIWNDDKDRLFLRDEDGLILIYKYP